MFFGMLIFEFIVVDLFLFLLLRLFVEILLELLGFDLFFLILLLLFDRIFLRVILLSLFFDLVVLGVFCFRCCFVGVIIVVCLCELFGYGVSLFRINGGM